MSLAKLFMDQCVGEYSGHMSCIPNNPLFSSIFQAAGYARNKKNFSSILRKMADELDGVEANHEGPIF